MDVTRQRAYIGQGEVKNVVKEQKAGMVESRIRSFTCLIQLEVCENGTRRRNNGQYFPLLFGNRREGYQEFGIAAYEWR